MTASFRGCGRGRLLGNCENAKATSEGTETILQPRQRILARRSNATYFCMSPFFLTPRSFLAGALFVGEDWTRLPARGVPYGGGLRALAASQSNGVEADREGVMYGDWVYTSPFRGVEGPACPRTGVWGVGLTGDVDLASFSCAKLKRLSVAMTCVYDV